MAFRKRSLLVCGLSLLAALGTKSAHAQQDPAAARALFAEGRRLLKAGQFAQACPKFEESLKLDHGMGTQFNLAHCWEKVGRTASAWSMFLDVAAAARASNQSKREAAARQRANSLEGKLTRLKIEVPKAVSGTVVSRDGTELGTASWGTATPVDPGTHRVRASAPGHLDWEKEVQVPSDGSTVAVQVPQLDPAPQQVQPIADPTPAPFEPNAPLQDTGREPGSAQKVAGLVVSSLGVIGVGVGSVFLWQMRTANNEALSLCTLPVYNANGEQIDEQCGSLDEAARLRRKQSDAEDNRTYGFIGLAAGGAALATGIVLFLTAEPSDDVASVDVTPLWLGGDTFGAQLTGAF